MYLFSVLDGNTPNQQPWGMPSPFGLRRELSRTLSAHVEAKPPAWGQTVPFGLRRELSRTLSAHVEAQTPRKGFSVSGQLCPSGLPNRSGVELID
jgi:hypothetical protein